MVGAEAPTAMVIAEESTAWPKVTAPVGDGGLGLHATSGTWAGCTTRSATSSEDRCTASGTTASSPSGCCTRSPNGSSCRSATTRSCTARAACWRKMPGDDWQRFANLRALYAWMWALPGAPLLFMGAELAPFTEWNESTGLPWHLLDHAPHRGVRDLLADLNRLLPNDWPALYERDHEPTGFQWLDADDADHSMYSFLRWGYAGGTAVACVANFTPGAAPGLPRRPAVGGRVGAARRHRLAGVGWQRLQRLLARRHAVRRPRRHRVAGPAGVRRDRRAAAVGGVVGVAVDRDGACSRDPRMRQVDRCVRHPRVRRRACSPSRSGWRGRRRCHRWRRRARCRCWCSPVRRSSLRSACSASGGTAASAFGGAALLSARNGVYGLAMSRHLQGSLGTRLVAAQLAIDESTAMAVAQDDPAHRRAAFWVTGLSVYVFWNAGTLVGALLGTAIDPRTFGLDAAIPAAFVAMLLPMLRERVPGGPRITGAAVCLALIPFAPVGRAHPVRHGGCAVRHSRAAGCSPSRCASMSGRSCSCWPAARTCSRCSAWWSSAIGAAAAVFSGASR